MRKTIFLIILFCLWLTGCSVFTSSSTSNHSKPFLAANSIPPLKIPPGVSSDNIQNEYPVSNKTYPPDTIEVSLIPPGLN